MPQGIEGVATQENIRTAVDAAVQANNELGTPLFIVMSVIIIAAAIFIVYLWKWAPTRDITLVNAMRSELDKLKDQIVVLEAKISSDIHPIAEHAAIFKRISLRLDALENRIKKIEGTCHARLGVINAIQSDMRVSNELLSGATGTLAEMDRRVWSLATDNRNKSNGG